MNAIWVWASRGERAALRDREEGTFGCPVEDGGRLVTLYGMKPRVSLVEAASAVEISDRQRDVDATLGEHGGVSLVLSPPAVRFDVAVGPVVYDTPAMTDQPAAASLATPVSHATPAASSGRPTPGRPPACRAGSTAGATTAS